MWTVRRILEDVLIPNSTPKTGSPLIRTVANAATVAPCDTRPSGRDSQQKIERLQQPEGRAKGRDLPIDEPGRSFKVARAARRPAGPLNPPGNELAQQARLSSAPAAVRAPGRSGPFLWR